jgi:hypothetical protein
MNGRAILAALVLTLACGGKSSERTSDGSGDDAGAENGGSSGASGGSSGASNTGGSSATSGSSGSAGDERRTYLYDQNNYQFTSRMEIPVVETASGVDIDVCWTDVVSDFDCNSVDPLNDIDAFALLRFRGVSEAEIGELLTRGELNQSTVDGYLTFDTDHESTCAKLSSLTVFGSPVDVTEEYQESDDNVYAFLFTRGTTVGAGTVTMVFGRPNGGSTNTTLDAPPGCGIRDFTPDLSAIEPVMLPLDAPWLLDWSMLTRDGQGNPIAFSRIDGLMLSFFTGVTLSEIEDRIGELDDIATESFRLDIGGERSARLTDTRDSLGQSFTGFSRTEVGIWLLTLTCSNCFDSAPLVLAILEPSNVEP